MDDIENVHARFSRAPLGRWRYNALMMRGIASGALLIALALAGGLLWILASPLGQKRMIASLPVGLMTVMFFTEAAERR